MGTRNLGIVLSVLVGICVMFPEVQATAQGYLQPAGATATGENFYLGFSIGEGTYINYRCDYEYGCDDVLVAPLDFEVLLGYKLAPNFYLDLALNWSVDYNEGYYDKVTYITGFRPGVRLVLPGLFNRHVYFRGAVPIQYTLEDEQNLWVVGLLLGVGIEWRFANIGFFVEADVTPYFLEIYPGYYVIPVQGRAGVSVRL